MSNRVIPCPECNSERFFRDGFRVLADGSRVQRYICRDCGYRFSDKSYKECLTKSNRQLCALQEAKKLDTQAETKTVCAGIGKLPQDARGLITKYMAYLEKEGYYNDSAYVDLLKSLVLHDGVNLLDPDDVKSKIARHKCKTGEPWKNATKMLATYAYDAFCKMEKIEWAPPHYKQEETVLTVADEKDLDCFIASSNKRMSAFYLCLKETFADPGEILRAEWTDLKDNILSINHPVKGHLPGYSELSPRLLCMLNNLSKTDKRIFPMSYVTARSYHGKLRKRLAKNLQNPSLLRIAFKDYRHFGGSMIAHLTNGNVLVVKKALRHKNIQNTMKYIHTIDFKTDDFEETTATTIEEIRALGKAGWSEYTVSHFNAVEIHYFRKPKRFGGLKC